MQILCVAKMEVEPPEVDAVCSRFLLVGAGHQVEKQGDPAGDVVVLQLHDVGSVRRANDRRCAGTAVAGKALQLA